MLFGNKVIKTGSQWTRVAVERVIPGVARVSEIERAIQLLRGVMESPSVYTGIGGAGLYTSKRIDNDLLGRIVEFLAERGQEL